jgi:hypothetical protein
MGNEGGCIYEWIRKQITSRLLQTFSFSISYAFRVIGRRRLWGQTMTAMKLNGKTLFKYTDCEFFLRGSYMAAFGHGT